MSESPQIVIIFVLPGASTVLAPACAADEPQPGTAVDLSPRERDILAGVARGECNKEIGRRLGIEATAKAHLRSIFKKIGVANRTQAALWALKNLHID